MGKGGVHDGVGRIGSALQPVDVAKVTHKWLAPGVSQSPGRYFGANQTDDLMAGTN
jgi:hypothetical protein